MNWKDQHCCYYYCHSTLLNYYFIYDIIIIFQGNLGQRETPFWLIQYNLKTIKLTKPKTGMIRPWSLKAHKQNLYYFHSKGQFHRVLQFLAFLDDRGKVSQAKIENENFAEME